MICSTNPETVYEATLAIMEREDNTAILPTIEVPTLFITGSEDESTGEKVMRPMAVRSCVSKITY